MCEESEAKIPEEQTIGYRSKVSLKEDAEKISRGEIVDTFIQEHLKGQIAIERLKLFLGIVLTVLIKYQWVLWIVFIIMYILKEDKLRMEAQKTDMERFEKRYERMDRTNSK